MEDEDEPIIVKHPIFTWMKQEALRHPPLGRKVALGFDIYEYDGVADAVVKAPDTELPKYVIVFDVKFMFYNMHQFLGNVTYFKKTKKDAVANTIKAFIDDLFHMHLEVIVSLSSGKDEVIHLLNALPLVRTLDGTIEYKVGKFGNIIHVFDPNWLYRELGLQFRKYDITFADDHGIRIASFSHMKDLDIDTASSNMTTSIEKLFSSEVSFQVQQDLTKKQCYNKAYATPGFLNFVRQLRNSLKSSFASIAGCEPTSACAVQRTYWENCANLLDTMNFVILPSPKQNCSKKEMTDGGCTGKVGSKTGEDPDNTCSTPESNFISTSENLKKSTTANACPNENEKIDQICNRSFDLVDDNQRLSLEENQTQANDNQKLYPDENQRYSQVKKRNFSPDGNQKIRFTEDESMDATIDMEIRKLAKSVSDKLTSMAFEDSLLLEEEKENGENKTLMSNTRDKNTKEQEIKNTNSDFEAKLKSSSNPRRRLFKFKAQKVEKPSGPDKFNVRNCGADGRLAVHSPPFKFERQKSLDGETFFFKFQSQARPNPRNTKHGKSRYKKIKSIEFEAENPSGTQERKTLKRDSDQISDQLEELQSRKKIRKMDVFKEPDPEKYEFLVKIFSPCENELNNSKKYKIVIELLDSPKASRVVREDSAFQQEAQKYQFLRRSESTGEIFFDSESKKLVQIVGEDANDILDEKLEQTVEENGRNLDDILKKLKYSGVNTEEPNYSVGQDILREVNHLAESLRSKIEKLRRIKKDTKNSNPNFGFNDLTTTAGESAVRKSESVETQNPNGRKENFENDIIELEETLGNVETKKSKHSREQSKVADVKYSKTAVEKGLHQNPKISNTNVDGRTDLETIVVEASDLIQQPKSTLIEASSHENVVLDTTSKIDPKPNGGNKTVDAENDMTDLETVVDEAPDIVQKPKSEHLEAYAVDSKPIIVDQKVKRGKKQREAIGETSKKGPNNSFPVQNKTTKVVEKSQIASEDPKPTVDETSNVNQNRKPRRRKKNKNSEEKSENADQKPKSGKEKCETTSNSNSLETCNETQSAQFENNRTTDEVESISKSNNEKVSKVKNRSKETLKLLSEDKSVVQTNSRIIPKEDNNAKPKDCFKTVSCENVYEISAAATSRDDDLHTKIQHEENCRLSGDEQEMPKQKKSTKEDPESKVMMEQQTSSSEENITLDDKTTKEIMKQPINLQNVKKVSKIYQEKGKKSEAKCKLEKLKALDGIIDYINKKSKLPTKHDEILEFKGKRLKIQNLNDSKKISSKICAETMARKDLRAGKSKKRNEDNSIGDDLEGTVKSINAKVGIVLPETLKDSISELSSFQSERTTDLLKPEDDSNEELAKLVFTRISNAERKLELEDISKLDDSTTIKSSKITKSELDNAEVTRTASKSEDLNILEISSKDDSENILKKSTIHDGILKPDSIFETENDLEGNVNLSKSTGDAKNYISISDDVTLKLSKPRPEEVSAPPKSETEDNRGSKKSQKQDKKSESVENSEVIVFESKMGKKPELYSVKDGKRTDIRILPKCLHRLLTSNKTPAIEESTMDLLLRSFMPLAQKSVEGAEGMFVVTDDQPTDESNCEASLPESFEKRRKILEEAAGGTSDTNAVINVCAVNKRVKSMKVLIDPKSFSRLARKYEFLIIEKDSVVTEIIAEEDQRVEDRHPPNHRRSKKKSKNKYHSKSKNKNKKNRFHANQNRSELNDESVMRERATRDNMEMAKEFMMTIRDDMNQLNKIRHNHLKDEDRACNSKQDRTVGSLDDNVEQIAGFERLNDLPNLSDVHESSFEKECLEEENATPENPHFCKSEKISHEDANLNEVGREEISNPHLDNSCEKILDKNDEGRHINPSLQIIDEFTYPDYITENEKMDFESIDVSNVSILKTEKTTQAAVEAEISRVIDGIETLLKTKEDSDSSDEDKIPNINEVRDYVANFHRSNESNSDGFTTKMEPQVVGKPLEKIKSSKNRMRKDRVRIKAPNKFQIEDTNKPQIDAEDFEVAGHDGKEDPNKIAPTPQRDRIDEQKNNDDDQENADITCITCEDESIELNREGLQRIGFEEVEVNIILQADRLLKTHRYNPFEELNVTKFLQDDIEQKIELIRAVTLQSSADKDSRPLTSHDDKFTIKSKDSLVEFENPVVESKDSMTQSNDSSSMVTLPPQETVSNIVLPSNNPYVKKGKKSKKNYKHRNRNVKNIAIPHTITEEPFAKVPEGPVSALDDGTPSDVAKLKETSTALSNQNVPITEVETEFTSPPSALKLDYSSREKLRKQVCSIRTSLLKQLEDLIKTNINDGNIKSELLKKEITSLSLKDHQDNRDCKVVTSNRDDGNLNTEDDASLSSLARPALKLDGEVNSTNAVSPADPDKLNITRAQVAKLKKEDSTTLPSLAKPKESRKENVDVPLKSDKFTLSSPTNSGMSRKENAEETSLALKSDKKEASTAASSLENPGKTLEKDTEVSTTASPQIKLKKSKPPSYEKALKLKKSGIGSLPSSSAAQEKLKPSNAEKLKKTPLEETSSDINSSKPHHSSRNNIIEDSLHSPSREKLLKKERNNLPSKDVKDAGTKLVIDTKTEVQSPSFSNVEEAETKLKESETSTDLQTELRPSECSTSSSSMPAVIYTKTSRKKRKNMNKNTSIEEASNKELSLMSASSERAEFVKLLYGENVNTFEETTATTDLMPSTPSSNPEVITSVHSSPIGNGNNNRKVVTQSTNKGKNHSASSSIEDSVDKELSLNTATSADVKLLKLLDRESVATAASSFEEAVDNDLDLMNSSSFSKLMDGENFSKGTSDIKKNTNHSPNQRRTISEEANIIVDEQKETPSFEEHSNKSSTTDFEGKTTSSSATPITKSSRRKNRRKNRPVNLTKALDDGESLDKDNSLIDASAPGKEALLPSSSKKADDSKTCEETLDSKLECREDAVAVFASSSAEAVTSEERTVMLLLPGRRRKKNMKLNSEVIESMDNEATDSKSLEELVDNRNSIIGAANSNRLDTIISYSMNQKVESTEETVDNLNSVMNASLSMGPEEITLSSLINQEIKSSSSRNQEIKFSSTQVNSKSTDAIDTKENSDTPPKNHSSALITELACPNAEAVASEDRTPRLPLPSKRKKRTIFRPLYLDILESIENETFVTKSIDNRNSMIDATKEILNKKRTSSIEVPCQKEATSSFTIDVACEDTKEYLPVPNRRRNKKTKASSLHLNVIANRSMGHEENASKTLDENPRNRNLMIDASTSTRHDSLNLVKSSSSMDSKSTDTVDITILDKKPSLVDASTSTTELACRERISNEKTFTSLPRRGSRKKTKFNTLNLDVVECMENETTASETHNKLTVTQLDGADQDEDVKSMKERTGRKNKKAQLPKVEEELNSKYDHPSKKGKLTASQNSTISSSTYASTNSSSVAVVSASILYENEGDHQSKMGRMTTKNCWHATTTASSAAFDSTSSEVVSAINTTDMVNKGYGFGGSKETHFPRLGSKEAEKIQITSEDAVAYLPCKWRNKKRSSGNPSDIEKPVVVSASILYEDSETELTNEEMIVKKGTEFQDTPSTSRVMKKIKNLNVVRGESSHGPKTDLTKNIEQTKIGATRSSIDVGSNTNITNTKINVRYPGLKTKTQTEVGVQTGNIIVVKRKHVEVGVQTCEDLMDETRPSGEIFSELGIHDRNVFPDLHVVNRRMKKRDSVGSISPKPVSTAMLQAESETKANAELKIMDLDKDDTAKKSIDNERRSSPSKENTSKKGISTGRSNRLKELGELDTLKKVIPKDQESSSSRGSGKQELTKTGIPNNRAFPGEHYEQDLMKKGTNNYEKTKSCKKNKKRNGNDRKSSAQGEIDKKDLSKNGVGNTGRSSPGKKDNIEGASKKAIVRDRRSPEIKTDLIMKKEIGIGRKLPLRENGRKDKLKNERGFTEKNPQKLEDTNSLSLSKEDRMKTDRCPARKTVNTFPTSHPETEDLNNRNNKDTTKNNASRSNEEYLTKKYKSSTKTETVIASGATPSDEEIMKNMKSFVNVIDKSDAKTEEEESPVADPGIETPRKLFGDGLSSYVKAICEEEDIRSGANSVPNSNTVSASKNRSKSKRKKNGAKAIKNSEEKSKKVEVKSTTFDEKVVTPETSFVGTQIMLDVMKSINYDHISSPRKTREYMTKKGSKESKEGEIKICYNGLTKIDDKIEDRRHVQNDLKVKNSKEETIISKDKVLYKARVKVEASIEDSNVDVEIEGRLSTVGKTENKHNEKYASSVTNTEVTCLAKTFSEIKDDLSFATKTKDDDITKTDTKQVSTIIGTKISGGTSSVTKAKEDHSKKSYTNTLGRQIRTEDSNIVAETNTEDMINISSSKTQVKDTEFIKNDTTIDGRSHMPIIQAINTLEFFHEADTNIEDIMKMSCSDQDIAKICEEENAIAPSPHEDLKHLKDSSLCGPRKISSIGSTSHIDIVSLREEIIVDTDAVNISDQTQNIAGASSSIKKGKRRRRKGCKAAKVANLEFISEEGTKQTASNYNENTADIKSDESRIEDETNILGEHLEDMSKITNSEITSEKRSKRGEVAVNHNAVKVVNKSFKSARSQSPIKTLENVGKEKPEITNSANVSKISKLTIQEPPDVIQTTTIEEAAGSERDKRAGKSKHMVGETSSGDEKINSDIKDALEATDSVKTPQVKTLCSGEVDFEAPDKSPCTLLSLGGSTKLVSDANYQENTAEMSKCPNSKRKTKLTAEEKSMVKAFCAGVIKSGNLERALELPPAARKTAIEISKSLSGDAKEGSIINPSSIEPPQLVLTEPSIETLSKQTESCKSGVSRLDELKKNSKPYGKNVDQGATNKTKADRFTFEFSYKRPTDMRLDQIIGYIYSEELHAKDHIERFESLLFNLAEMVRLLSNKINFPGSGGLLRRLSIIKSEARKWDKDNYFKYTAVNISSQDELNVVVYDVLLPLVEKLKECYYDNYIDELTAQSMISTIDGLVNQNIPFKLDGEIFKMWSYSLNGVRKVVEKHDRPEGQMMIGNLTCDPISDLIFKVQVENRKVAPKIVSSQETFCVNEEMNFLALTEDGNYTVRVFDDDEEEVKKPGR